MKRTGSVLLAVALAATTYSWVGPAGLGPQQPGRANAQVASASASSSAELSPEPSPALLAARSTAASACPARVARPFWPKRITIPGVTSRARVITPRDQAGRVPGVPPLTAAGREMFAWDKDIKPGAARGKVRMNAHVWPDGSAVGNRMLRELVVGDRIVVLGKDTKLCYRVAERIQVRPSQGLRKYYDSFGKPRLAIVVCSGKRLGPGRWTHRTIWYAKQSS